VFSRVFYISSLILLKFFLVPADSNTDDLGLSCKAKNETTSFLGGVVDAYVDSR
jgi:hypothetical protein